MIDVRTRGFVIVALMALAVGCDGGGGGDGSDDAGSGDAGRADAGMGDAGPADAGGGTDACTGCDADGGLGDAGVSDGDDTFATATEVELDDDDPPRRELNPPGDLDYYRFEGTAGQWIGIYTVSNLEDDDSTIDTVVTLFDASMNQIAENDDRLPRVNTDSELVTRLPADGTYYVLVQEWSTWSGGAPNDMREYVDYVLLIQDLTGGGTPLNYDPETGNDAAHAQSVILNDDSFAAILGTFTDDSDVDVFSITIPEPGTRYFTLDILPSGISGGGPAAPPARLWFANADGTDVLARIAPPEFEAADPGGLIEIEPYLPAGDYTLFLEGGGGADFYHIKFYDRGNENPPELDDRANDSPDGAQALVFEELSDVPAGTTAQRALVLLDLGEIDASTPDVDYFSIDVPEGQDVSVTCGSRTNGSGVIGLEVALLGTDMSEIVSVTETATESAIFTSQPVPSAGTYLVRITKASQDPEVSGDFARCGFYLTTGL